MPPDDYEAGYLRDATGEPYGTIEVQDDGTILATIWGSDLTAEKIVLESEE